MYCPTLYCADVGVGSCGDVGVAGDKVAGDVVCAFILILRARLAWM